MSLVGTAFPKVSRIAKTGENDVPYSLTEIAMKLGRVDAYWLDR